MLLYEQVSKGARKGGWGGGGGGGGGAAPSEVRSGNPIPFSFLFFSCFPLSFFLKGRYLPTYLSYLILSYPRHVDRQIDIQIDRSRDKSSKQTLTQHR